MSTRAYKLIEVKCEQTPTFNLSHDTRIYNIGDENGDIFTIYKERAEKLLKEVKELELKDEPDREYYVNVIKQIIVDCGDEEWVEYYCY